MYVCIQYSYACPQSEHVHVNNHMHFVFHADGGKVIGAAVYPGAPCLACPRETLLLPVTDRGHARADGCSSCGVWEAVRPSARQVARLRSRERKR